MGAIIGDNAPLRPSPPAIKPDLTEEVRQLENRTAHASQTATSAHGANLSPVADMLSKLVAYTTGFNNGGQICYGRIIDGSAVANCYRVNIERGTAPRIAVPLMTTSQAVIGATEINSYAPGSSVLLYMHSGLSHAFILGVVPDPAVYGRESIHDSISGLSRARVDEGAKRYLQLVDNGGLADFSCWKPFDNTQAGEWGATTVTGLKITLDDFMVQMAVNEFTGIFGFYHDQLLRIGGYNLQTWTAGHERDAYMDQAEYNDTQGYSPYPWEAMGMLKPGSDMIQTYTPEEFATAAGRPYYSNWENKYESQQPFHRTQKYYGYYGQGSRTVVCAPPPGPTWWAYKFDGKGDPPPPFETKAQNEWTTDVLESRKGPPKPPAPVNIEDPANAPIGLSEDNTGIDGRRFIASAKGITLTKRMLLPVPARLRRPEDGNGDDAETNYKAASKYGAGPAHKITGDIKTTYSEYPHLQRAAGILDLHGYLFNYAGLHPFHWHAKDYRTYEQSELQYAQYNSHIPDYTTLKGSMYLPQPSAKSINIDHRYNSQNFYETESYLSLLEDGTVVIGDGYGAEIRMCAGSITISAPGDVWFKPGKNAQIWAGRDIIMRANNSVDISTTEENVRIKAEQNVMILAGNDTSEKQGGVLIESRATAPTYNFDEPGDAVVFGGVILRAKSSEVIGLGKNIYMRTTGGYGGTGDQAGVITLDASLGDGNIVTKSRNLFEYIDQNGGIYHYFRDFANPGSESNRGVANLFQRQQTLLGNRLYVNGSVVGDGKNDGFAFIARGSIITNSGHIFTQRGGPVAPCQGDCNSEVNAAIEKIKTVARVDLPKTLSQLEKEVWAALWYNKDRPGNADTIKKLEFSFRRDEDYKIDNGFVIFEDRWQQYARIGGQTTGLWEERPVKTGGGVETWPFPGKEKMTDPEVFKQQNFSIVEVVGNAFRDKDRGSGSGSLTGPYSDPEFRSVTGGASLQKDYYIIKKD
jgi:hypothetical protein